MERATSIVLCCIEIAARGAAWNLSSSHPVTQSPSHPVTAQLVFTVVVLGVTQEKRASDGRTGVIRPVPM